jgi:quercetin dioxygenase-like cupin family protein
VTLYNWSKIEREQVNPLFVRQVIYGEKITIARIRLAKGCIVPEHTHASEQISTVHQGKLLFRIGGSEIILEAEDVLHIPSNVPHQAEALEDTLATDVFSPTREDWRTGNDDYLRR